MNVATQEPAKHRIDSIGGIRCWSEACKKPLFKVAVPDGHKIELILFIRCPRCGVYNIVDFASFMLE